MWVRKNDKKYGSLHHKNVSKKNYIRKFWTVDQVGKEKNMNYGSAFDEKSGWGKTEGKNMDQNFIKMWVKKII